MAIVQIPMGNINVPVEVPDFAYEITQQDILEQAKQQTAILSNIAGGIQSGNSNDSQLTSAINENTKSNNRSNERQSSILSRIYQNSVSSASKILDFNPQTATDSIKEVSKIFEGFGDVGKQIIPALGVLGTTVGILEELGNVFSVLNRVGAGFGSNLIDLRDRSARIGLSLQDFSKIVVDSGAAVAGLSDNTTEGTRRFSDFVSKFRETTANIGYFGMSSQEMAQFMADELELRRQIFDTETYRNINEKNLSESLRENIELQTVMARITGQDVRDRLKAQQDFKRDAINSAILASLTDDQIDAVNSAVAGFSEVPGVQATITDALRNMMAGFPTDDKFNQLAAAAEIAGVDLRGSIGEINELIKAGADEEAAAAAKVLANSLGDIDPSKLESLVPLALAGFEGAIDLLTGRATAITTQATSTEEVIAKMKEQQDAINKSISDGSAAIQGLGANIEQVVNSLKSLLMLNILQSMGINPDNLPESMGAIAKFSEFATMLSSTDNTGLSEEQISAKESINEIFSAVVKMGVLQTGAQGLSPAIGGDISTAESVAGISKMLSGIPGILGLPEEITEAMRIPTRGLQALEFGKLVMSLPKLVQQLINPKVVTPADSTEQQPIELQGLDSSVPQTEVVTPAESAEINSSGINPFEQLNPNSIQDMSGILPENKAVISNDYFNQASSFIKSAADMLSVKHDEIRNLFIEKSRNDLRNLNEEENGLAENQNRINRNSEMLTDSISVNNSEKLDQMVTLLGKIERYFRNSTGNN